MLRPYSNADTFILQLETRGGARGGLGGYSPLSEHASPPSESEKRFCQRFLAFIVP